MNDEGVIFFFAVVIFSVLATILIFRGASCEIETKKMARQCQTECLKTFTIAKDATDCMRVCDGYPVDKK